MSIAIFFTGAACLLPWIAYFLADWKLLAIATSAPLLLAIFTPFVVPESARWLVSQGKVDKAIGILKKLEKGNGRQVPPQTYQIFADSCKRMREQEAQNGSYSVLDLFKSPRLRRTTLLLIVIWMESPSGSIIIVRKWQSEICGSVLTFTKKQLIDHYN